MKNPFGGTSLRTMYKIIIAVVIVGIITYYTTSSVKENDALEGPTVAEPLPQELEIEYDALARPTTGVSTYIGQNVAQFTKQYGEPNRIDVSEVNDEWYVYNASYETFMLVGIETGKVAQIYVGGAAIDMAPFAIEQPLDELYRSMIIQSEVSVPIENNMYSFTLSEQDLHQRLLIAYDELYVQVYLSEENGTVQGVRFLDAQTLVAQQPYEMIFMGELVTKQPPTSYQQVEIHAAQASQLSDLANVARTAEQLLPLVIEPELNELASAHSDEMAYEGYLSSESPTNGDIKQQLEQATITYHKAGSNVALSYVDAIEAMHGWLNSPSHRDMLMQESFTHIGSGVFLNNYTQIFIEQPQPQ